MIAARVRNRPRIVVAGCAAALFTLAVAGCGGDDAGAETAADGPTSHGTVPGDHPPSTTWSATVPTSPVDPADVSATYRDVVDAVVEATGAADSFAAATTRTESFDDRCVVTLSRTSPTSIDPEGTGLQDRLGAALADSTFPGLQADVEPSGRSNLVAYDPSGAFLEIDYQPSSTVVVRVLTTDESC